MWPCRVWATGLTATPAMTLSSRDRPRAITRHWVASRLAMVAPCRPSKHSRAGLAEFKAKVERGDTFALARFVSLIELGELARHKL